MFKMQTIEDNQRIDKSRCCARGRVHSSHGKLGHRRYGNARLLPASELAISSGLMKPRFQIALALLAFVAVGGCSRQPQGHALPEPPRVAACEPGIPGGRLVLSLAGNPRTFNPVLDANGYAISDGVIRMLFSSLVEVNLESQEAEPGLAESWSVGPDQKTWTFKLRKNLRWSDGEPLTADDVVFTWNDVMYNPKYNEVTYELFRSNGKNFEVTKVDDVTVRVVTPEVFAPFVEYFGSVLILPKHTLQSAAENGQFLGAYSVTNKPESIVGSGPFRLKQFQSQRLVLLERNPEYWIVDKQGRRLPYLDEVQLLIAGSDLEFQSLFFKGTSAAYENVRPKEAWEFQQAATNAHFQILDLGVGVQRDFFWFNQNTGADRSGKPFVDPVKLKWFRDKRFRQAISCAINRDRIVHDVYNGRAQAVYGFLSADNKKWNNPLVAQYAYDPKKAGALLAELGLTNRGSDGTLQDAEGHAVQFSLISSSENPVRGAIALRIDQDLRELGIRLDYRPMDFATMKNQISGAMAYLVRCDKGESRCRCVRPVEPAPARS